MDSGHLVAYEPTLNVSMGFPSGLVSSVLSGEGW